MSVPTLHTCSFCGQVSHNSRALATFAGDFHCSQCDLSASEGNFQMQEDLVTLFARQMHMDMPVSFGNQEMPPSGPSPITYSITQHYHHSSHVARCPSPAGSPEQDKSLSPNMTANSIHETLRLQNINPASLSSTQLQLFKNAMPEQRSRLIQVWQICPVPNNSSSDPRAKRVDQSISELHVDAPSGSNQSVQLTHTDDLEMCDSMYEGDNDDDGHQYAEPYVISGYEILAQRDYELSVGKIAPVLNEPAMETPYRLANDPIYKTQGHRWWERSQADTLEYQYGTFDEMNQYGSCGFVQPKWLA
ncbi:hypothetical protein BDV28DRAFT_73835 [Aspergillus coremiiformis]|uniref:Uncharacterized protein n=1 Tax=Aspergillus coremiiformis TaxID=138285 RepID=A0A5N6YVH4_9EURO|nr:hypothetical protein BDV28DRAFT_73835 [Aspergillus coremiiformis]